MIPIQKLRRRVGLDPSDDSQDELLLDLEEEAIASIEAETGRYFGPPAELTEIFQCYDAGAVLHLTETPLADPAPVVDWPEAGATISTSSYWVDGDAVRARAGVFSPWGQAVRVRYTAGYEPGQEPKDVQRMVMRMVEASFNQQGMAGFKSKGDSGFSVTTADPDPDFQRFVERWRRIQI